MIIKEKEDTILIQNILNGSFEAQNELYYKYKKIVRDFINKKYSQYHDIDDDVSEIMIKIIMGIDTYDKSKSKFKSWVFNITKNHMIDKWRSSANTLTNTTLINTTYSTTTCANIEFENNNSVSYISKQLSPKDFTLLDMKYVQGYDYCEIGKEFNVTSSTISNRVNYIKTKLKKNNVEVIY